MYKEDNVDIMRKVRVTTREKLRKLGYSEEAIHKTVNSFWKPLRVYHGEVSSVLTYDGVEVFL